MRIRSLLLAIAVCASPACMDQSSCFSQTQTGPTNVEPSPRASPSPSPSASPVATTACAEWHAFIASFGWEGPPGSVRPNNQQQPYPLCVGCHSLLTGTLKTPQGDATLEIASGKGRPEWTLAPDSIGKLDITTEPGKTSEAVQRMGLDARRLNNSDGYNLLVTPVGRVGDTATVHLKFNALCVGEPVAGDFKYVITAS